MHSEVIPQVHIYMSFQIVLMERDISRGQAVSKLYYPYEVEVVDAGGAIIY